MEQTSVEPFAGSELRAALRRPSRILHIVLADRRRLGASVLTTRGLPTLLGVLLVSAVVAALPFGAVVAGRGCWKVALLYLGSVLLCSPALQVFAAYLGRRLVLAQTVALALIVAAVAALFSFGFFPIVWFLDLTMHDGDWIDSGDLARVLLGIALLAGLAQTLQCAHAVGKERLRGSLLILLGWEVLVIGVTWRMARTLELL